MLLRWFFLLLFIAIGLSACGSSSPNTAVRDGASGRPADLFTKDHPPTRLYTEKTILELVQNPGETEEETLERLRWMATDRGCDAVIVLKAEKKVRSRAGWYDIRQGFRASCVVYTSGAQARDQTVALH
jgi:hypothetical protein